VGRPSSASRTTTTFPSRREPDENSSSMVAAPWGDLNDSSRGSMARRCPRSRPDRLGGDEDQL
jgi:hypothetical protein